MVREAVVATHAPAPSPGEVDRELGLGVHEVERDRALPAQADDPVEVERLADGAPVHAPDALADLDAEARRRRACVVKTRDRQRLSRDAYLVFMKTVSRRRGLMMTPSAHHVQEGKKDAARPSGVTLFTTTPPSSVGSRTTPSGASVMKWQKRVVSSDARTLLGESLSSVTCVEINQCVGCSP